MDTFFASGSGAAQEVQDYMMQTQSVSPTTGQTVTLVNDDKDRTLVLTPAGAIAALTITFPSDANSRLGQIVGITTSQPVVAVTLTAGVSVSGFITSLSPNDFAIYQKIAANTWRRQQ